MPSADLHPTARTGASVELNLAISYLFGRFGANAGQQLSVTNVLRGPQLNRDLQKSWKTTKHEK